MSARTEAIDRVLTAAKGAPEKVQRHMFEILSAWVQEYEEEAGGEGGASVKIWDAIVKKVGPPAELDLNGVPPGVEGDRLLDRLALAAEAWRERDRIPAAE